MQTVYDVFLLAPLGIGVADQSAGGSLVVVYLTGREIKNCLEFMLIGNPNRGIGSSATHRLILLDGSFRGEQIGPALWPFG